MSENTQQAADQANEPALPAYLPRLQKTILEIFHAFETACDAMGLTYWADGGTVLGAERHGGFIPWDDDLDVGMLRPDWEKFVEHGNEYLPEGFTLHTWKDTPGMPVFWAQIWKDGTHFIDPDHQSIDCDLGIYMDIFPFVRLDRRKKVAERQKKIMRLWQGLSYVWMYPKPTGATPAVAAVSPAAHAVLKKITSQEQLNELFWKACDTKEPGNFIVDPCNSTWSTFPIDVVMPPKKAEFAGIEINVPAHPGEYLALKYGDWRQVPPPEQRRTHRPMILDFGDGVNTAQD